MAALAIPVVYGQGARARLSTVCRHCAEPFALTLMATGRDLVAESPVVDAPVLWVPYARANGLSTIYDWLDGY